MCPRRSVAVMTPRRSAPLRYGAAASLLLALAACTSRSEPTLPSAAPTKAGSSADSQADSQADSPAYALSPTCPRPARRFKVTVDYLNGIVHNAHLPLFLAGDIGASAELSDGRMVWVFGDTVRAAAHTPRVVANSMLVTSGVCISQVVPPDEGPVVPDPGDGVVFWPMSVARIDPPHDSSSRDASPDDDATQAPPFDDILLVAGARVRRGGGAFDFTVLGTSVAVLGVRAGESPQPHLVVPITRDRVDDGQVNWGSALLVDHEYIYAYGTRLTGRPYEFGRELYVGRLPAASPGRRASWRFWNGTGWVTKRSEASPILPASDGVSQTLSVSRTHGSYVIVSKRGGDLGDYVFTWSAPTPVGPWTARQGVSAPFGLERDLLKYAPLAHPEVPLKSGRLLISISRNTTDFGRLLRTPEIGLPQFAEVPVGEARP